VSLEDPAMSGYFGTEAQQRLQAQAERSADFVRATPGACQTGRTMGCDDPDRFGWDRIDACLKQDGVFGFRLLPAGKAEEVRARLDARGVRFDTWDVYLADAVQALGPSERILAAGPPAGAVDLDAPTEPEGEAMRRIQALMGAAGVVPFSGSMLAGGFGPVVTAAVGDGTGAVIAAAHGYLPHNGHSPLARHAWGGLVAVAEAWRGRGLGAYVNARMVVGVFRDLGASHVYELVSASNLASRRMVESCGLRRAPGLVCGVATAGEGARFTR
jgi:RimJ/RimL family protein N-acetyltransferase